jgi:4'-phosphopantetheinyl transferase
VIYIDDHIDDFDLQEALAAVSPQRREYALRYRHERDQRLCVAAYRLLQQALLKEYGIDELPQFIYNQQDKPLLEGHPDIHFSLSHCREAVACAIGVEPVGIDIETLDHYSEEVATRVMNEQEMLQIKASPEPAREFTRLWTMKESLYKLTGDDHGGEIAHMLDDTSGVRFKTLDYPLFMVSECRFLHTDQLDL